MRSSRNVIGYVRVSTQKQGDYGISRDGQKQQLSEFAKANGLRIKKFYTDIESALGEDNFSERPGFLAAIERSLESGWPIICASADRFSRTSASYDRFVREGGKVYSADIGFGADDAIMRAAIRRAEVDGRRISQRTREGQRRAREKGVRFGNPRLDEARRKSAEVRSRDARVRREELRILFESARTRGAVTHRQIAEALNKDGVKTAYGRNWSEAAVRMTLTKIHRDDVQDHEASARAEAERAGVVGADNRITDHALRRFRRALAGKGWDQGKIDNFCARLARKVLTAVEAHTVGRRLARLEDDLRRGIDRERERSLAYEENARPRQEEFQRERSKTRPISAFTPEQIASAFNANGHVTARGLNRTEANGAQMLSEPRPAENAALDDAALREPNATPLDDGDDLDRKVDDLVRKLPAGSDIIINHAELYELERVFAELEVIEGSNP